MPCTIVLVYVMLYFSCILRPMNFKMRYLKFKSDGWIFLCYEVERRREEGPVFNTYMDMMLSSSFGVLSYPVVLKSKVLRHIIRTSQFRGSG